MNHWNKTWGQKSIEGFWQQTLTVLAKQSAMKKNHWAPVQIWPWFQKATFRIHTMNCQRTFSCERIPFKPQKQCNIAVIGTFKKNKMYIINKYYVFQDNNPKRLLNQQAAVAPELLRFKNTLSIVFALCWVSAIRKLQPHQVARGQIKVSPS